MSSPLHLRGDCIFDGQRFVDGDVEIVLDQARIERIEPVDPHRPLGPAHLDARGSVIMPGLVNAHVHIARGGVFEATERVSVSQAIHNLRDALAAGTTTVGDMGCAAPLLAALRARTHADPLAGPQIRGSGPIVTAPEGYPLDWMPPLFAKLGVAVPCSDDRSARQAAEHVAGSGMNHLKLAIMHLSYSEKPIAALSASAARAAADEAHANGLKVFAHAHSLSDYRVALTAGVDALMHSSFEPLDADTVAAVRDAGIPVCPTLWVFDSVCLGAERRFDREPRYTRHVRPYIQRSWRRFAEAYAASGSVLPAGIATGLSKARVRDAVRTAAANLALLRDAGVPIAFGNDASYGFSLVARPVDELATMQRAGMSSEECLRAATSAAAALLGCADRGSLRVGSRADVLVVDRRVKADVAALEIPRVVIAAGQRLGRNGTQRPFRTGLAFVGGVLQTVAELARGRGMARPPSKAGRWSGPGVNAPLR